MVRHLVNVAVVGCSAPDCQVFHKDLVEVPSLLVCYRARVEGRSEIQLLQLSSNYRQLLIEVSAYDDLCILVLLHNISCDLGDSKCPVLHSLTVARLYIEIENVYLGATDCCSCPARIGFEGLHKREAYPI